MSLPSTMKAVKSKATGHVEVDSSAKLPTLKPGYMLVKVSAVAINPTDWKHVAKGQNSNHTVGCDYVGTVVEVSDKEVTTSWKKGDRAAGFAHGVNKAEEEDGCFAEYARVVADVQMKVPDNISDEEAATFGVGITTVGQGLYQSLGLPMPDAPSKEKTPVLIYGGSTATGLFAIQFAKLSGLNVVVTCSPRNFDLVKSLGADAAFDYSDPEKCAKDIRDYTNNSLKYAFDCISEGTSPKICGNAMSSASGGKYSALLPVQDFPRSDVEHKMTLGYTINGEAFNFFGNDVPAKPEDKEFGAKFFSLAAKLLADGKLKAVPREVRSGGLEGTLDGMEALKQGKVSGQKLVYKV